MLKNFEINNTSAIREMVTRGFNYFRTPKEPEQIVERQTEPETKREFEPPPPEDVQMDLGRKYVPATLHTEKDGTRKVIPKQRLLQSNDAGSANLAQRVSVGDPNQNMSFFSSLAVFSPNSKWRKFALQEKVSLAELQNIPIEDIAELLADVSPEVSLALHIRTILSNAGYKIEARKMDSDDVDEDANNELKAIRKCLSRYYGTEDVIYNQAFLTIWLRGGFLAELVLQDNLEDFADIATPDPKTLRFRKIKDEVRGDIWEYGQYQNGTFIPFNDFQQIKYVPFMPFPNKREGRPLISSSFFIAVFIMAVLRDFKRVIQQQGYPRNDVSIDFSKMQNLIPDNAQNDPAELEKWAKRAVSDITTYIEGLEPDETYVHGEFIEMNQPVGAMSGNILSGFDSLFNALERIAARGCKVPPLFMGIIENVSEANANRQFEAFIKDLQSGQEIVQNTFIDLYELALQAKGFAARVHFEFETNRQSERVRDAQANLLEAQHAAFCYFMGWYSQEQAARFGAKVETPDQDEPRENNMQISTGGAGVGETNGDGGVNRFLVKGKSKERVPTASDIVNAKNVFQKYSPEAAAEMIVAETEEIEVE